ARSGHPADHAIRAPRHRHTLEPARAPGGADRADGAAVAHARCHRASACATGLGLDRPLAESRAGLVRTALDPPAARRQWELPVAQADKTVRRASPPADA